MGLVLVVANGVDLVQAKLLTELGMSLKESLHVDG
jgi:hypothetical protein